MNDTIDGTHIKFLVEDEEELKTVAEEEAGHDGDKEVCEVLLPSLAGRARCPEVKHYCDADTGHTPCPDQIWVGIYF